jgi:hypothetical protein
MMHCNDHPVAACPRCSEAVTFDRIGADGIMGTRDFCPMCRADLTFAVLQHLAECTVMRAQVRETRERARETLSNGSARNGSTPHIPNLPTRQERRNWRWNASLRSVNG